MPLTIMRKPPNITPPDITIVAPHSRGIVPLDVEIGEAALLALSR
jgi:hypothetical protein